MLVWSILQAILDHGSFERLPEILRVSRQQAAHHYVLGVLEQMMAGGLEEQAVAAPVLGEIVAWLKFSRRPIHFQTVKTARRILKEGVARGNFFAVRGAWIADGVTGPISFTNDLIGAN